jgi:hypothetical protein
MLDAKRDLIILRKREEKKTRKDLRPGFLLIINNVRNLFAFG